MKDLGSCYNCKVKIHSEENKHSASHNGLPVQVCTKCAEKAGLIQ